MNVLRMLYVISRARDIFGRNVQAEKFECHLAGKLN